MGARGTSFGPNAATMTSSLAGLMGAFVFAALTVTTTAAAELKGFGPVAFDMSKDEAWSALDGKGRWAFDDLLMFDVRPFDNTREFEVKVLFDEGRIRAIWIYEPLGEIPYAPPPDCLAQSMTVSRQIHTRYGVKPVRRLVRGVSKFHWELGWAGYDVRDRLDFTDVFSFDGAAYIEVRTVSTFPPGAASGSCTIDVFYNPPSRNPVPF